MYSKRHLDKCAEVCTTILDANPYDEVRVFYLILLVGTGRRGLG